ncbi:facilitated trehalose transporter Tret1-like isoform X2 [Oratosquilla oratoria]
MEVLGPRRVLLAFLLPTTSLWFLKAFATGKKLLYVARFGIGLSNGAVYTALVPLSVELMSPEVRGMLTTVSQIMASAGIMDFYLMAKFLPWRVATGVCAAPLAFVIVALYFVPESPYWLMKKGKESSARAALARIRGPRGNVEEELGTIRRGLASQPSTTVKDQFRQLRVSSNYTPVLLATALNLLPVLGGRFAIFQYAIFIFQDAEVDLDPFTCTVLVGVVRLVFTIVSCLVIDHVGRRPLLITCSIISGASLVATGVALATSSAPAWLPIASILVFTAVFSLGVPPVCFLLSAELVPTAVRSVANSIFVNVLTLGFFLSSVTFPMMNATIGFANTFHVLASFYLLTALLVWRWVPESRGRTLVDLQEAFATDKSRESYRKIGLKKNIGKEDAVEMLQN